MPCLEGQSKKAREATGIKCDTAVTLNRLNSFNSSAWTMRLTFITLRHLLHRQPEFALVFYSSGCSSLSRRLRHTLSDLSFARELAA